MPPDWVTFPPAGSVSREALRAFREKGYALSWSHRDVWREEHNKAFTVAGAMRLDILRDIRESLDAALADGVTFEEWRARGIQEVLEAKGWWGRRTITEPGTGRTRRINVTPHRLRVIYETNARTSRARGQWTRIQRTKDVLPFLEYNLGASERHRPNHEAVAGTVLRVDDDFWGAHMPPNGFGCKCWVRQLTEGGADAAGGESERPAEGPADEGWDFNPGETSRV